MAGRHPDPRIYVRRKVHDSELAMLILVDASLSSDFWVAGKRIFDVVSDSAQVLIEAFEPTSAKLGLGVFYSNTRRNCRFLLAKGFDDSSQTGLRRLHAVFPSGYTRIGPAIRHTLELLEQTGARRRLVLLLTDAKPTDYDHYEGALRSRGCATGASRGWRPRNSLPRPAERFVSVATSFLKASGYLSSVEAMR